MADIFKSREWDIHKIYNHQLIDLDEPPKTGEIAILSISETIFEVEIIEIKNGQFFGKVKSIGPTPKLDIFGVSRGDNVEFVRENIKSIRHFSD